MNKKILLILIIILLVIASIVFDLWWQSKSETNKQQADEVAIRSLIDNFGQALKKVSLLSPTAAQDIEENYKDFLSPALLSQWKDNPSKAVGRITSSPWPDRIEISSVKRFGSGAYDVSGSIIEITNTEEFEGGIAAKRSIDFGVVKFNNLWLITGVVVGEYINE
jgi:hypothetical protein